MHGAKTRQEHRVAGRERAGVPSALATLKARAIIEAAAWKDTLQVRNQRMNVVQADPYSCRLGNKNPESEMGSRNQARPASMMVRLKDRGNAVGQQRESRYQDRREPV